MTLAARSSHPRPRRNALVFGGSPRIDAALVHRLAEDGFRVALAHAGASILAQEGGIDACVARIAMDDDDAAAFARAVERAVDHVGELDAVVVNAGTLHFPLGAPIHLDGLELRLAVDVRGVYRAILAAVARMRDGGRIVTLGNNVAEWNGASAAIVSMSRAAIASLVKGLALDLAGRRIVVNNVQSGPIDSDMAADYAGCPDARVPLGWTGKPHEVAALVAYLASDACGPMTGATITLDGGFAV